MPRQKLVPRSHVQPPTPISPNPVREISREAAIAELSEVLGAFGKDWKAWQPTDEASKSLNKVFSRGFSEWGLLEKRKRWTEGVHYRKPSPRIVLYNLPAIVQDWYRREGII